MNNIGKHLTDFAELTGEAIKADEHVKILIENDKVASVRNAKRKYDELCWQVTVAMCQFNNGGADAVQYTVEYLREQRDLYAEGSRMYIACNELCERLTKHMRGKR